MSGHTNNNAVHSQTKGEVMKKAIKKTIPLAMLVAAIGCGSVGTSATGTVTSTTSSVTGAALVEQTAAGAVASLFANPTVSASLSKAANQPQQQEAYSTCADALGTIASEGPDDVLVGALGTPGVYGSADNSITIEEEDFCALPASPTTLNTAAGFDSHGLVATFELQGSVNASCTDDEATVTMLAGSSGVWRNATIDGVEYQPQIWGTFLIEADGEESTVDCTIYLGEDENVLFADCSDGSGAAMNVDDATNCTLETSENAQSSDNNELGQYTDEQAEEDIQAHQSQYMPQDDLPQ